MKINIIRSCNTTLEYIYISAFFRLFGIKVYNKMYSFNPRPAFRNKLTKRSDKNDTFTILIADNFLRIQPDYSKLKRIADVVISGLHDKQEIEDIKFPNKYNSTRNRYSYIFFQSIISKITKKLGSYSSLYFNETSNMIDFYLEAELLSNWYLPSHVIKSSFFVYDRIKNLKKKEEELSELYYRSASPNFIYAIGRLKYTINKLCIMQRIEPEIDWTNLFEIGINLLINDRDESRYNFYIGHIFDLSKTNNMAAEIHYQKCIDDDDYYVRYLLARLCEFRLNDKQRAQNYLEEAVKINKLYYKSYYKLGMYAEEADAGEKAFSLYSNVIGIISERLMMDNWQVDDITYFIKSCGKIKQLRRFGGSEDTASLYEKLAEKTINYIDKNRFFVDFAKFLSDSEEKEKELLEYIKADIRQNINYHIDRFCK